MPPGKRAPGGRSRSRTRLSRTPETKHRAPPPRRRPWNQPRTRTPQRAVETGTCHRPAIRAWPGSATANSTIVPRRETVHRKTRVVARHRITHPKPPGDSASTGTSRSASARAPSNAGVAAPGPALRPGHAPLLWRSVPPKEPAEAQGVTHSPARTNRGARRQSVPPRSRNRRVESTRSRPLPSP